MTRSKVAVIRVRPDSILEDIDRLHALAEVEKALSADAPTLLKDHSSWHFPFPGANTTPWQLEGTVRSLRARGYEDLVCVQNTTVALASKGEDLNGYVPIFKKYDIPVRSNFKPEDMTWATYRPKAKMLVLDKIFPDGIQLPDQFHATNMVHLPTVKCHISTTTAGAMNNAFGALLDPKRHYMHAWIHEALVDVLAIQKEIHAGLFAVMDGTTAGDGPGPRTLRPVVKDVMLASSDQTAIDAVAAAMMGFDPMSLRYIKLADEAGLGNGRRENIEVVGNPELADQRWGFSVGDSGASMVGDVMRFGPLKRFQKMFFQTPLVNLFAMGSEAYRDYYRWPLRDRKIFEQWKESTTWGQLFDQYQANGTLAQPVDVTRIA